jgi:hypothetical protein
MEGSVVLVRAGARLQHDILWFRGADHALVVFTHSGGDTQLGPDPSDYGRSRDPLEQERSGLVLAEPGAAVDAVQMGIRLSEDEMSERFRIHHLCLRERKMDNDVRGERSRNGMSGLYNGNPPLGYSRQSGYAVKDAESFSVMKEAWELMETGTKSLRDMANMLNERGIHERRKGHMDTRSAAKP